MYAQLPSHSFVRALEHDLKHESGTLVSHQVQPAAVHSRINGAVLLKWWRGRRRSSRGTPLVMIAEFISSRQGKPSCRGRKHPGITRESYLPQGLAADMLRRSQQTGGRGEPRKRGSLQRAVAGNLEREELRCCPSPSVAALKTFNLRPSGSELRCLKKGSLPK